jgi:hypothetical protein
MNLREVNIASGCQRRYTSESCVAN